MKWFLLFFLLLVNQASRGQVNVLAPVATDSPRDTFRSFLHAMETYREGIETHDSVKQLAIQDAISTLDLNHLPVLVKSERAEKLAIYLKEILDRIDLPAIDDIPTSLTEKNRYYRLPQTEIYIALIENGVKEGDYLFSQETVDRLKEFYDKVKHLPYKKGKKGALYSEGLVEKYVPKWSKDVVLGLLTWQWFGIFLSILIGLVLRKVTQYVVQVVKKMTDRSKVTWDDKIITIIEKPAGLIVASIFWYFAIQGLQLEGFSLELLLTLDQIIFSASLIWLVYRSVDVFNELLQGYAEKSENTLDDQLVPLFSRAIRMFVLIFGLLVAVQNLGVNVMSLVAGLGLGGLAFALAAKDAAANLFGSIMILWDQPFRVGDWVIVGKDEGTVEEIGFRSTRLRTFYNSQITLPNSVVANANIDNMGRRQYRRVRTELGVCYDTSPEKMELFLEGIKNVIKANPDTRKDYYHVVFNSYGAASLNILLYFFVVTPDWSRELVVKQNIFLEILRLAKELGIEFAFPTQTLHIDSFHRSKIKSAEDLNFLQNTAKEFGPKGDKSKPEGLGYFKAPYLDS